MPDQFVSKASIERALKNLRGTADPMIKVWLTLKAMGLTEDQSVTVDTTNSKPSVDRLFGFEGDKYFVPIARNRSDLTMSLDAPRSQIQTNVKKFHDRSVGFDPNTYLRIEQQPDKQWKVGVQASYPIGLGFGKNGFARGDNQKVAIPIRAWSVWFGRKTAVASSEADPAEYLVRDALDKLHLNSSERVAVFFDDNDFEVSFSASAITDDELASLIEEAVAGDVDEKPIFEIDEQKYLRKLYSVRSQNAGPRWLLQAPAEKLRRVRETGAQAILLYGPPRTGKTRAIDALIAHDSADRLTIQIHDGWGYEHLMLGQKAEGASFTWKPGPLLDGVRKGKKVIVLEEANRTQLSQSLGEVFSLLESRYRGPANAQKLRDGSDFFIPNDVVFYFTLNTLDNSTEEIDDALLGRVASVEFPPRVEDLREMLAANGVLQESIDRISEFFAGILPKYQLGHGYFAPVKSGTDLLGFYQSNLRPVLQKHFRHDAATLEGIDLLADDLFRGI